MTAQKRAKKRLVAYISDSQDEMLRKVADQAQVTVTDIVARALEDFLSYWLAEERRMLLEWSLSVARKTMPVVRRLIKLADQGTISASDVANLDLGQLEDSLEESACGSAMWLAEHDDRRRALEAMAHDRRADSERACAMLVRADAAVRTSAHLSEFLHNDLERWSEMIPELTEIDLDSIRRLLGEYGQLIDSRKDLRPSRRDVREHKDGRVSR